MADPDPIWTGTYSHLPHGFFADARILDAGDAAALLLLRMSDFADVNHTDGYLTDGQMSLIGPGRGRSAALDRLQSVGLLDRTEVPAGWQLVGWAGKGAHRTRAQVEQISKERASAGAKGGRSKRKPAPNDPQAEPEQIASPPLDPRQSTPPQDNPTAAIAAGSGSRRAAAVVDAAALAIARLGIDHETAGRAGLVGEIERALEGGWTKQGIAEKAAVARSKAHPTGWFIAALVRGADPSALQEM